MMTVSSSVSLMWNAAGCPGLGRRMFRFELSAVVSSLRYFLCLIAVVPSLTVAADASWDDWRSGGSGWRGGVATTPYCSCSGNGYPFYAATVIRLTGGYGYVTNHSYDYGYRNAYCPYVRRRLYAALRGARRVRAHRSVAAVSSLGSATTPVPSSPSKTMQAAPAGSASLKSAWTPMTVPVSPSPANERPKAATEEAERAASEWVKKIELKLNQLSPDMSAASALLEQDGFRVDGGNKSTTGWFLTAHDSNQRRGSIKLQSDGTKIVLTVTGTANSIPGYSP